MLMPSEKCEHLLPQFLNIVSPGYFKDKPDTPVICAQVQDEVTQQKKISEVLLQTVAAGRRDDLPAPTGPAADTHKSRDKEARGGRRDSRDWRSKEESKDDSWGEDAQHLSPAVLNAFVPGLIAKGVKAFVQRLVSSACAPLQLTLA
jgi:hypothetical protein